MSSSESTPTGVTASASSGITAADGRVIELVLFDLDGTLLDPVRNIRPANLAAIERLRARGLRFAVATGRTPRSAAPYVARIAPTGPNVHFNGAMVWDMDQGRPSHVECLPRADAVRAVEVAEAHGVHVNAYVGDEVWIARESQTSRNSAEKDGLPHTIVGDLRACIADGEAQVVKLMLIDEDRPVMRLVEPIAAALERPCTLVNSEAEYLEMLPPDVTKGTALQHISRIYGIPLAAMLAFGDRPNDLDMLRRAGVGVARGSGHPDVQAVADRVIGGCDTDAISDFLCAYLGL